MGNMALALKYRPQKFEDVVGQKEVCAILENQLESKSVKQAYLFCGPAGDGKTTTARIFARKINDQKALPIELDAASNNGVDDIRDLIEEAQTKPLDADYKIFIIDEAHMITTAGWNAFLKTLEEPPVHCIFIMCTTNPEKIPATILSRTQRYNFKRISTDAIADRLEYICQSECDTMCGDLWDEREETLAWTNDALMYIAKAANGGLRDAITMLDKCISYSKNVSEENVVKALGLVDYRTMLDFTYILYESDVPRTIEFLNQLYFDGVDIKQFIKEYFEFVLDTNVFCLTKELSNTKIPSMYENDLRSLVGKKSKPLLDIVLELNQKLRYEQNPREFTIARFIQFLCEGGMIE